MIDGPTANIAYRKVEYLVDANGAKVGVVSPVPSATPDPMDTSSWGNVSLDKADTLALLATGEGFAGAVDALVKTDLIKRGIIQP